MGELAPVLTRYSSKTTAYQLSFAELLGAVKKGIDKSLLI